MLILNKLSNINIIGEKEISISSGLRERIMFSPCSPNPQNELCKDKCVNDEAFYLPFIKGDKLFFQWHAEKRPLKKGFEYFKKHDQLDDKWEYNIKIRDLSTEQEIEGIDILGKFAVSGMRFPFQIVVIDTALIPYKDFVLIFESKDKDGNIYQWFSEFYKDISDCNDISTVVLQGFYCNSDAEKNYYREILQELGVPPIQFELRYRFLGEFKLTSINYTQEAVNNKILNTERIGSYTLRLNKIPERMAKKIDLIFSAQRIFINGIEIITVDNIEKNFDEGNDWLIEVTLQGRTTNNKYNCTIDCYDQLAVRQRDETGCNNDLIDMVERKINK